MVVLGGEDGMQLEYVSQFKYLRCVLDESGTDGAEYCRKWLVRGKWWALSDLL